MPEPATIRPPTTAVPAAELPTSLRDAGLASWIREPLDNAVDRRRRIIFPPAVATMGTPLSDCQPALLAQARRPDTVFMMGDNPALPKMPESPTLKDFFQRRFSTIGVTHLLQSAKVARENGLSEKVIMACLLHDIAIAGLIPANHGYWGAQMVAKSHGPSRSMRRCATSRTSRRDTPTRRPTSTISAPITARPTISAANTRRRASTAGI